MDIMKTFLSDNPAIGMTASLGGAVLPLIDSLTPILQFVGMLLGVIIGLFTCVIKYREWKHNE